MPTPPSGLLPIAQHFQGRGHERRSCLRAEQRGERFVAALGGGLRCDDVTLQFTVDQAHDRDTTRKALFDLQADTP